MTEQTYRRAQAAEDIAERAYNEDPSRMNLMRWRIATTDATRVFCQWQIHEHRRHREYVRASA